MNKKAFLVLSISMLAVALAAPLMAQSFVLKANVPFEFTVGDKAMPAGEYLLRSDASVPVVVLQGEASHAAAVTLMFHKELGATRDPASITRITFDRYGSHYFLREVDNGYTRTGYTVPMSHTERELSKTASLQHNEIVAVLAQR